MNACIRDALKGEMIAVESQEMDALLKYVRMFEKSK
jgi:cytochrome c